MDVSAIEAATEWDGSDLGHLTLFVPLIGSDVAIVLFPAEDAPRQVTGKMAATVADILALKPGDLARVKDMLWEEANFTFTVADYGIEPEAGETALAAHLRAFDLAGPEDAYREASVREIHVEGAFEARFAQIKIKTATDTLVSIIVKDGRIVDWDEDGTHLGWFDEDDRAAAAKRARLPG